MEVGKNHLGGRRWLALGSLLAALACAPPLHAQTETNVPPLQIDDSGSYLIDTSFDNGATDAWIGGYNPGNTLTISSSGSLFNVVYGFVGALSDNNLVTVDGGSWANNSDLVIGNYGNNNNLIIQNGGTVSSDYGYLGGFDHTHTGSTFDGYDAYGGNNNSVQVTGAGSTWTTFQDLSVGWSFSSTGNSLTVDSGGAVSVGGIFYVGYYGSGNSVTISNGGQLTSSVASYIGNNDSYGSVNSNTVHVSGSGSVWNSGGSLFIGNCSGSGNSLIIDSGGQVINSGDGVIGNDFISDSSSNNTVHVSGSGSVWNNSGDLYVGGFGSGNSLVIDSGGQVINGINTYGGVIGFDDNAGVANNNTVLVTGSGSLWNDSSSDVYVGYYSSSNNLTIANGGVVINGNGYIGYDGGLGGGISNSVVVTDSGSIWSNTGSVFLGYQNGASSNSLIIANGGQVFNIFGIVGNDYSSSNNMAWVTGIGSLWSNSADLFIGNNGSFNGLTIDSSGQVMNGGGFIGWGPSSGNNTVLVTGNGSVWTNNGDVNVGYYGSGNSLTIASGGQALNNNGYIGQNSGANNNSVTVTNAGSLWNNSGDLFVGFYGVSNSLVIANGGTVFNAQGIIGVNSGANGNAVLVTGAGSVWSNSSDLYVGNTGSFNQLTISSGGTVFDATGYIGIGDYYDSTVGNSNTVLVTGAGSVWSNSSDLIVGSGGSFNQLTIANSGTVFNVQGVIGANSGANGNAVLVTGAGSVWSNSSDLYVGNTGSFNQLTISSGGTVFDATGYIGIGDYYDSTVGNSNTVLVTGAGSVWSNSSDLIVGSGGSFNQLTIANSGTVFNANGYVSGSGSNNMALVTGAGSVWNNSGELSVGAGSFNQMIITNGGTVFSTAGWVGSGFGAANSNTVLVTGAGSLWSNSLRLTVGTYGSFNQLTIANGGTVLSDAGWVGYQPGDNGNAVLVTGAGSVWSNSYDILVGVYSSFNQLTIINGGTVYSVGGGGQVGSQSDANSNSVLVADAGSLWDSGGLIVGWGGSFNQLIITNGGTVLGELGSEIGHASGAISNAVLVTGAGSLWNNGSDLFVGNDGSFNQLTITNGGTVFATRGFIGGGTVGNSNTVLVTGAGSLWSNSSDLMIGLATAGNQLIITNGGTVRTLGTFTLGANSALLTGGGGTLYVGSSFDNQATNQTLNDFSGTTVFNGGGVTQSVEVASAYAKPGLGGATNFYFGTFQVGDPVTGSNAWVQLVDNHVNTAGAGHETLGASNLIVALPQSVLDLNNRTSFVCNLSNAGTILQTNASPPGVVTRLDVVNTFTNAGTVLIGNGSVLQFSNAFINAGMVQLQNGGVLTNFVAGNVLTNNGSVVGDGVLAALVNNAGTITATGGVLNLTGGFNNNAGAAINTGLLAALGASAQLNVAQAFTNVGAISLSNGTLTAPSVNNSGNILGYGTFNAALNNTGGVTNSTSGQTLTFTQPVNNNVGGTISALNNSSLAFNNALLNSGAITVQDQSTATFAGAVTNAGTITVQNQSLLNFNAGLTNNGTLAFAPVVNPSTAIITGSLTLGSGGVISMWNANDMLVVRGSFVNGSTNNNSFNTLNGVMVFGAAGPLTTNTFEVAGRNLGTNVAGFNNNFAIGTLNVTNGIRFVDYINNGGGGNSNEVLYVDVLHLFSGATLKLSALTIYVGFEFIDDDGTGAKTFTTGIYNQGNAASFGLVNVFIDNGGQIVIVPEPSTYALLLAGAAAMGWWRRRCRSGGVGTSAGFQRPVG